MNKGELSDLFDKAKHFRETYGPQDPDARRLSEELSFQVKTIAEEVLSFLPQELHGLFAAYVNDLTSNKSSLG